MLTENELRAAFCETNTAEPLAEGWPGLLRFAREVEALTATQKCECGSDEACLFVRQRDALSERLGACLTLIFKYGGIDGSHHKQWVLDQVARALTGDGYAAWVAEAKAGEDGPDSYDWDEGIAP